jgi:hypothetical protein
VRSEEPTIVSRDWYWTLGPYQRIRYRVILPMK